MPENTIIRRIKALCQTNSWSYYRLAKESGLTYSTLNAMLKKGAMPSIPTLEKICAGFGISMEQFFAEDEARATLSAAQKEHLKSWGQLSEENKAAVEKMISFLLTQQDDTEPQTGTKA